MGAACTSRAAWDWTGQDRTDPICTVGGPGEAGSLHQARPRREFGQPPEAPRSAPRLYSHPHPIVDSGRPGPLMCWGVGDAGQIPAPPGGHWWGRWSCTFVSWVAGCREWEGAPTDLASAHWTVLIRFPLEGEEFFFFSQLRGSYRPACLKGLRLSLAGCMWGFWSLVVSRPVITPPSQPLGKWLWPGWGDQRVWGSRFLRVLRLTSLSDSARKWPPTSPHFFLCHPTMPGVTFPSLCPSPLLLIFLGAANPSQIQPVPTPRSCVCPLSPSLNGTVHGLLGTKKKGGLRLWTEVVVGEVTEGYMVGASFHTALAI